MSTTVFIRDGRRQLTHATLFKFSRKAQEDVISKFKATPGCGHVGVSYDQDCHVFEIKCNFGDENLCIHTFAQLTANVAERCTSDRSGTTTIIKIPEAFVHINPFADDIDDDEVDSTVDAGNNDDEDQTEKGRIGPQSKSGTSQATGPRDLLPQLAALNVTEDQNWYPKHPRTNIQAVASPEIFDAIGRLSCCGLTLVDDVKIFCKPQTLGDEVAVRKAIRRLDNVEKAQIQEPIIDHLIKTKEDTSNYQLTIEHLESFEDTTYGRTFVPPTWWPEEEANSTKYLSRSGVLRVHKYNEAKQDYYPWQQPDLSRPAIPAEKVKDPFRPIVLRSLEATALPEEEAILPPAAEGLQSIEGWLRSTQSPSISFSSSSGKILTMTEPSRITASTNDATERWSSSQSTRASPAKTPKTFLQVNGTTTTSASVSRAAPYASTPSKTSMSSQPTRRLDLGKKKNASAGKSGVDGPSAKYSSENGYANLISYESSDDSSGSDTTVAPLAPPGYNISSPSSENVKIVPPHRHSSKDGGSSINLMDADLPLNTPTRVTSSELDNTLTEHTSTDDWSTVTFSKSKKKAPAGKAPNVSNMIIERKADDEEEPRRRIFRGSRKKARAPASKASKNTKGSDALKKLKADFDIELTPKPSAFAPKNGTTAKTPTKLTQPAKPSPKCSPRLLTCVKSAFEQARLHRGSIQSRFEIGRVLMHHDTKVTDERMDWAYMKAEHLTGFSCFKTFQGAFTPSITTASRDMCAILLELGITSDPFVSIAIWELTCSTTDKQEVRIVVNASDDTEPVIEAHKQICGATYVHRPQNVHDARWISFCISYKDCKAVPGAQELLDSLHTPQVQDLEAAFSYPELQGRDRPALSVKAVQLRVSSRYALPDRSANHYIEISRIVEPRVLRREEAIAVESHPFRVPSLTEIELSRFDVLWYEVSLGLIESPHAFKENESLDVGSEASWTVDQVVDKNYEQDLAILEAATNDLVERMDNLGLQNRGMAKQLEMKRKNKRAKAEVDLNKPFTQAGYQAW